MIYLLAKYTLLFLLSVLLGVLLGRWWIRRSYVDVTDSYTDATQGQEERGWNKLWSRLDMLDGGIEPKISSALAGFPATPTVDLSGIEQRLAGLERRLETLPKAPTSQPIDLQPLTTRLDSLERAVTASRTSEPAAAAIAENVPQIPDLSPISERIADLERYVRTLPRTDHQLDLSPIKLRLGAIEGLLQAQSAASSAVAPEPPAQAPAPAAADTREPFTLEATPKTATLDTTNQGPQLFASASAGSRDNLKKISGVGPKLEDLLNQNGVYYFWQIASWTDSDVVFMDQRLDVFKGRIGRDNWVAQAKVLKSAADAAKAPD